MTESSKPSPGRGWTGQSPGRVWGGTRSDLVPPLFRRLRAAPSPKGRLRALSCLERVARQSRDGCGGDPWRFKPGPILCVSWLPSSVRAFGPATFPVGEGCLRRGLPAGGTFPQGKVEDPLPGEGQGSYFFVVLLVSSVVLPWTRASIRVREYSIWL